MSDDAVNGGLRSSRRIVLIGSMGAYHQVLEVARQLNAAGIQSVVPDAEDESVRQMTLFEFEDFKRRVSFAHLRRIRDPRTYCVLAVNPDRHGILNYLGPNTFAEIAVAFSQSKKIYLLQGQYDAYADELSAWRSISLMGHLQKLVADFQQDCMLEDPQKRLF